MLQVWPLNLSRRHGIQININPEEQKAGKIIGSFKFVYEFAHLLCGSRHLDINVCTEKYARQSKNSTLPGSECVVSQKVKSCMPSSKNM
jgi:hypothetical protein